MGIDLKRKMRGFRPLTHMIIVPTVLLVSSLFLLLAIIDFKTFDSDPAFNARPDANDVRVALIISFLMPMVFTWFLAAFFFLLICCPNRIWYAIVSILLMFSIVGKIVGIKNSTSNVASREIMEMYTYGSWAFILDWVAVLVADIYMAIILFILGFFYELDDEDWDLDDVNVASDESSREESNESTEK